MSTYVATSNYYYYYYYVVEVLLTTEVVLVQIKIFINFNVKFTLY